MLGLFKPLTDFYQFIYSIMAYYAMIDIYSYLSHDNVICPMYFIGKYLIYGGLEPLLIVKINYVFIINHKYDKVIIPMYFNGKYLFT